MVCYSRVVKIMGPFWVPNIIRPHNIQGTQKGTIILTTTHMMVYYSLLWYGIILLYDSNSRLWYIMVYFGIFWYILVYYGIFWYIMVYYGVLWYIMVYHGML